MALLLRSSAYVPPVLLLTATVIPPPTAIRLTRSDPWTRLQDYRSALAFYLQLLGKGGLSGIVFGDNSAADLSGLRSLTAQAGLASQVEFISVSDLNYPAGYGRSYGEFRMLDCMMARSSLLQAHPAHAPLWKVAGRYIVRNLAAVMATWPSSADLYCHCRDLPVRTVELRMMGFTRVGYGRLLQGVCEFLKEERGGRLGPSLCGR